MSKENSRIVKEQIKAVRDLILDFDPWGPDSSMPEDEYDQFALDTVGLFRNHKTEGSFQAAFRSGFVHYREAQAVERLTHDIFETLVRLSKG